jgi:hypothetical protein
MVFSFAVTVLIIVAVLKLLNWIPLSFQKEDMRKYKTVEDVKAKLKISRVYAPTYFPERIKWPPVEIFAQKRPFVMVMMHFTHVERSSFALSVYQVDAKANFEPKYKTELLYLKRENTVSIKGRQGTLVLAVCRGNEMCNRVSWVEGMFRITLISDDKPDQLLRMAESMLINEK